MASVTGPPDSLLKPLIVPAQNLLGAGPCVPSPRVRAACTLPQLVPSSSKSAETMKQITLDIRAGIQYMFQTESPHVMCVSGPGHAAMESVCISLVEPGQTLLVCVNGFFGAKMDLIASRYQIVTKRITRDLGEVFTVDDIQKGLETYRPQVLFVTYGETSTGALQPSLDLIGSLCHRYDCLLMVDSVAAVTAVPFFMDKWEVDAVYASPQKALAGIVGVCPVAYSQRAWEKITTRLQPIQSYNFDATLLADMWSPETVYMYTPLYANIYALREAFSVIADEGLENSWKKHAECAALLTKGLVELGLELLVKDVTCRLPTVTAVRVPTDIKDGNMICNHMADRYGVTISGGLVASTRNNMWRIGLMGSNATAANVDKVLEALRGSLEWARSRATA